MRVFVPATVPMLARCYAAVAIDATTGYAVTPTLREWYATGDTEELEYAALTEAARASVRLLAAGPAAPARRIVVAADAPRAVPDAGLGRAGVRVPAPLVLAAVAAVHADEDAAEPVVRAAAAAVGLADAGDADAVFAVDEAEGFELLWFATQEIPDLLHEP